MPIDAVNVLISCFFTGMSAMLWGWSGFIGGMIGHALYFFLIREFLF